MKVTGLSKYYGGLTAVNNVNLNIHYGEILALVGDNGRQINFSKSISWSTKT
ncbi:MAG: hypothetical protein CM15mP45_17310 [Deltaproteobacteria bacterium]|nr:MAG: hypothetical protein CM15mP45_17310 [Deltaproteobacteria bacterium]